MDRAAKPKHLSAKLLTIRQQSGASQSQMVRLLKLDCHYGRISEYELAKRQPSVMVLLRYARHAKITIDDLVDDEIELKF